MYINVSVGTLDNKVSFNMSNYDFDSNPIVYYDYGSNTVKNIDQASSGNYGVRKYPVLKEDSTEVQNGAICIYFDHQMDTPSHPEISDTNKASFSSMGFGMFNNEQDAIISKVIQYTNRVSGQGYSSSESNVEYTEVEVTEDPPEKWESERTYAYYLGHEFGTSDAQKMYGYNQITPANYDWDTLKQYLENNPSYKLYKNTELSKRIIIGDEEHCVSFNVGKFDFGAGSEYAYPYVMRCARNCPTNATQSGGTMIPGTDPTDVPYQMWSVISSPWSSTGDTQPVATTTGQLTPFYTNGRLSTSAPATKAHPVTECTLLQFGQVKYDGKTYTGVWKVTYRSAYYWGYKGNSSSNEWTPGAWNQLSTAEVSYDAQMNTYDKVQQVSFFGVDLSIVDVPVETGEGDIPTPPVPAPTGGNYAYPTFEHEFWDTESFGTLADPDKTGFHVYYLTADDFAILSEAIFNWRSTGYQVARRLSDVFSDLQSTDPDDVIDAITSFAWGNSTQTALEIMSAKAKDISSAILFVRKMPSFVRNERYQQNTTPLKIIGEEFTAIKPDYFKHERVVDSIVYEFTLPDTAFQTGTFYDLSPYSTATLFLPYYGQISLPMEAFIGKTIKISYAADVVTGKGGILVITTDKDDRKVTFGPYECDMSVSIPLGISDSYANHREQNLVHAAANTAVQAATGNIPGAVASGALSVVDYYASPKTQQMITTFGSGVGYLTPGNIMLQMTYPATIKDEDNEVHNLDSTISHIGASSYINGKVKDFLNEGKLTKYSYVNTASINATQGEKDAIERLMREGVY